MNINIKLIRHAIKTSFLYPDKKNSSKIGTSNGCFAYNS